MRPYSATLAPPSGTEEVARPNGASRATTTSPCPDPRALPTRATTGPAPTVSPAASAASASRARSISLPPLICRESSTSGVPQAPSTTVMAAADRSRETCSGSAPVSFPVPLSAPPSVPFLVPFMVPTPACSFSSSVASSSSWAR
ncbi:hypothetical protein ACFFX0_09185 [Citricoccus parietis]|uniref:Uncharacterized protein n=1 Tax=Citricoccus parietis TaxID=592307 RepID=A0ABV5FY72_9MICC